MIWDCFKRENIQIDEETLKLLSSDFHCYPVFKECLEDYKDEKAADLLSVSEQDDDFSNLLFFAVRDQHVKSIQLSKAPLQVLSSGAAFSKLSKVESI